MKYAEAEKGKRVRTSVLIMKIDPRLKDRVSQRSKIEDRSMSCLVERAIRLYLGESIAP